jgi:Sec-independent protein translocase protein TatA
MISYTHAGFPVGQDLWPIILLAVAFGLLLFLLVVIIVMLSNQTERLRRMTRHLRELSSTIQQQSPAIQQPPDSQDKDLTLAPVSPAKRMAEKDLHEAILREASKKTRVLAETST